MSQAKATAIKCGSKIMIRLEYVRSKKGETPLSASIGRDVLKKKSQLDSYLALFLLSQTQRWGWGL